MTARQQIQLKPRPVQEMLKIWMVVADVKEHIHPLSTDEQMERAAYAALDWWRGVYLEATELIPSTEEALAEELIARIRKQEVWGKILRGSAN